MDPNSHANSTFAGALLGRGTLISNALLALAGSLLIAILAQISVPLWPVPITGQTLGVLLVAGVLGPRRGVWAMAVYIAEGAVGLPVFAGGSAGLAVLTGPTAGYLVGFAVAALVVGALIRAVMDRRPSAAFVTAALTFLTMLIGSAVIYVFGVLWLAQFTGWSEVIAAGVTPFLLGDALKAAMATIALPIAWKYIQRS